MGTCWQNNIYDAKVTFSFENSETQRQKDQLYSFETEICKIKFEISEEGQTCLGIGFFCEINIDTIPFKTALFTNNHVLNEKSIDINKEIIFDYCKKENKIKITKDRKVFTNEKLDYTCIEIFDEDNINKFFKIDENIFNNKNTLLDQEIYILKYDKEGLSHCSGKILEIKNNIIKCKVSSLSNSSGSPLINRQNNDLIIGIQNEIDKKGKFDITAYSLATPFDVIIKNIKEQISYSRENIIYKQIIYRNTINLIYEKNIKDENSDNIFGQKFVKNNKENIILKINGIIENNLTEKFNLKEGINNIQIIIINKLINLESMFFNVISLKNIDELKYLNTKEVSNFSDMFGGCTYLSDIKALENWNVSNGNDFSSMFEGCSSLSEVKALENWNVSNGNNFSGMFNVCTSLSDINALQNWNVSNGNNFACMFNGCLSLSDIKALENWNISNGNNFSGMFAGCSSLSDLKALKNWNVSNGKNFSYMFSKCSSLLEVQALQNWNVSNGEKFSCMFSNCPLLSDKEVLESWNAPNKNNYLDMF